eukprot:scaffold12249_cov214-Amphora_coffeaeformis.AAC.1
MRVSVDNLIDRGYVLLIDFLDEDFDYGLYLRDDSLYLYPYENGDGFQIPSQSFHIVLTRASDAQVYLYVNGQQYLSYVDEPEDYYDDDYYGDTKFPLGFFGIATNDGTNGVIRFMDDNGDEDEAASIDLIRIYDNVVLTEGDASTLCADTRPE